MADNIAIATGSAGGSGSIATDQLATGEHVQFMKLMDGTLDSTNKAIVNASGQLTTLANRPVNITSTGTLSASDAVVAAPVGDGTLISGTSTAGSVVAVVVPDGFVAWTLLIKNYTAGTVYTEASNNSTNGTDGDWVEVKGRRTGTAPGTESVVYAMVANGYYRGNAGGFKYIRARLIGTTGIAITWVLSSGMGATFLNSGIPAGSSVIGFVSQSGVWNVTASVGAGTNMIGNVTASILSLGGSLPAGTNMIGNVTGSILSIVNPLPTGTNTLGTVSASVIGITNPLPAGTNMLGNVTASVLSLINPLPAGTNKIGTVDIATAPAVAKGTQGANAIPTQDLKDSGRTAKNYILDSFAIAATTETIMTLSGSYSNAVPITSTAFSASVGKTLRIQSITANIHTITGNTTAVNVLLRIRTSGSAALVTSPVQSILALQGVAAANSSGTPQQLVIPDGWEFPNPVSFAITTTCAGFVTTTAAPKVDITVTAYEY